jgi:hypothetical protein
MVAPYNPSLNNPYPGHGDFVPPNIWTLNNSITTNNKEIKKF